MIRRTSLKTCGPIRNLAEHGGDEHDIKGPVCKRQSRALFAVHVERQGFRKSLFNDYISSISACRSRKHNPAVCRARPWRG